MKSQKPKLILMAAVCVILAVAIPCIFLNGCIYVKIIPGVSIDGENVSKMTREEALNSAEKNAAELLMQTKLTLEYNAMQWSFTLSELGASLNTAESVQKAMDAGNKGGLFTLISKRRDIKENGHNICSEISITEEMLESILDKIKSEIDTPVVQPVINFDASEYDYFDENMNPRDMFEINEGTPGCKLDTSEAVSMICQEMSGLQSANIELPINEILPDYSSEELEGMTSLVCHSSCLIPQSLRYIPDRNHNMQKVMDAFKGLVVMPGEAVSFFDVIGEPSHENFWQTSPVISRDRTASDEFQGLYQPASTILNAAFRAGAQIIEHHHMLYPAYYKDFGYGMDVDVKYGEKDLIFKNTSDYPMFFDTYFCYDSKGRPGYVDVDVYTMPVGEDMYMAPIGEIVNTIAPLPAKYEEVPESLCERYDWTFDEELGMYIFPQTAPRDGYIVQIYKAVYENGVQISPGVWTGGDIVFKEEYEKVEYPAQQGLIYLKPLS